MINFSTVFKDSQNLNILYVEDDIHMLESTSHLFEDFFSSVDTAIDGQDGLEKYIAYKDKTSRYYDLIITDINMPKKNGIEMIKDIREINLDQAIIVVSAYNDTDRLMELIREGISDFISKPILPVQLMQIIYKVSQSINNKKIKDEFLISQSKLASMGEMIDTIAHQWLAPINLIKMQAQLLEMEVQSGAIKKEDILECVEKQSMQIEHIIETLHEFREFFRPSVKKESILYKNIIDTALLLIQDKLKLHTVTVNINIQENIFIDVIPSEFKHVLINIITNAIDEFKNKKIEHPKITINSFIDKNDAVLEIIDNAGGVPLEIIDKIFEINFTTKEKSSGTGVGLHLAWIILQKINATICVENIKDGAKFIIKVIK